MPSLQPVTRSDVLPYFGKLSKVVCLPLPLYPISARVGYSLKTNSATSRPYQRFNFN